MNNSSNLPPAWHVPQSFHDRLGTRIGRQRPMEADGHLLLILHAPPRQDDLERAGRLFWRSTEGEWRSNGAGSGINAVNKHLDDYEDVIARLDRQEEESQSAEDYFDVLEQLSPIHRAARNQHRVLQEARKLCPQVREIIDLRDRAYAIERTAELLLSGTQHALDFAVLRRAEDQAQASQRMEVAAHRLNILAAFFFPIATLTAVLGVDWNDLPALLNGQVAIPLLGLILVGLLLGAVLTATINRN